MKKLFLSTLLLALPLLANAYDIAVENDDHVTIYYNYINNGTELEVTYKGLYFYSTETYSGEVNIPDKVTYDGNTLMVTSIGEDAIDRCSGLTSVTIPNSVTTIGRYAFRNCYRLTSVAIPNSVTTIGDHAFYNCTGLTSVTIGNSVTTIGEQAFYSCTRLTSVTFGNSVTTIGEQAFYSCTRLTSVTIPNSVTTIGNFAFDGCGSLTSVTIPNSVTTIEQQAFLRCTGLTTVVSKMETPCSIEADCFDDDIFNNVTLYVPEGTTERYQSTDYWNKFRSIKEFAICATPTIGYSNKKLTFSCETEGVEYHYTITDTDIKSDVSGSIDLSATYEISVYATKSGYEDSEVATATLVWTNAVFSETTGITTSAKAVAESIPVLISARDGNLVVTSELEGQPVAVYSIDGKALGSGKVKGGQAIIPTNQQKNAIIIVKVGDRSVKVKM